MFFELIILLTYNHYSLWSYHHIQMSCRSLPSFWLVFFILKLNLFLFVTLLWKFETYAAIYGSNDIPTVSFSNYHCMVRLHFICIPPTLLLPSLESSIKYYFICNCFTVFFLKVRTHYMEKYAYRVSCSKKCPIYLLPYLRKNE